MKTKTQRIVMAAMLAAITCVATMVIKIPSPMKGYLNLGDCVVLLTGWLLSPVYGFFSAGVGSSLADLLLGYAVYAPATFVIKGLMAVVASTGFSVLQAKSGMRFARILSGIAAELVMVLGYVLFEGFLYGFIPSAVNIPANVIQGVAGLVIGVVLINILGKNIHKRY